MTKWIVAVETECTDPAREDEFNAWYNNTHLSDILETEGFVRATRFEAIHPSEGQAKYLAIYEVDADDLQVVMDATAVAARAAGERRSLPPMVKIVAARNYRQIYELWKKT